MPSLGSPSVTIEELLSERRVNSYQIGIFTICAIVAVVDGFDFQSIAVSATLISKDVGIRPPRSARSSPWPSSVA